MDNDRGAPDAVDSGAICRENHRAIARSALLFEQATIFLGSQDDGRGGSFRLGRCKSCGSTIGLEGEPQQRLPFYEAPKVRLFERLTDDVTVEQCRYCGNAKTDACCRLSREIASARAAREALERVFGRGGGQ